MPQRSAGHSSRLAGGRLIVACAYPSHPLVAPIPSPFERGSREAADQALAAAREAIGSVAETELVAVPGVTAAAALRDLALRESADLVVVGTSHRAVIAGVAVGSVSEQVAGAPRGGGHDGGHRRPGLDRVRAGGQPHAD